MSAHSDGRQEQPEDASGSEGGPARGEGERREKGGPGQAASMRESQSRGQGVGVADGARPPWGQGVEVADGAWPPAPSAPLGPARTSSSSRGGSHGSSRRGSEASLRAWRRDAADAWSTLTEAAEARLGGLEKGLPFALSLDSPAQGEAAALCPPRDMPAEEGPGERSLAPGLPPFLQAQAARAAPWHAHWALGSGERAEVLAVRGLGPLLPRLL